MAFRADEARSDGYEHARNYLISRNIDLEESARSHDALLDMIDSYGPVVDAYPHWHPLVSSHPDCQNPITHPQRDCGYEGLDHTVYFANAFVTCPYDDGQDVIDAVNRLPHHRVARICAERLEVQLYHSSANPILVTCQWSQLLPMDGMIPKSWAVPLILEREMPCWTSAQLAETWETMRPYLLGRPHGSRSSLFINQETGQAIKSIWNALINTGMFGPIRTDFAHRP